MCQAAQRAVERGMDPEEVDARLRFHPVKAVGQAPQVTRQGAEETMHHQKANSN